MTTLEDNVARLAELSGMPPADVHSFVYDHPRAAPIRAKLSAPCPPHELEIIAAAMRLGYELDLHGADPSEAEVRAIVRTLSGRGGPPS